MNTASKLSSIARFANSGERNGGSSSSGPQSIGSRPESHALLMREIIASLGRCPYSPPHSAGNIDGGGAARLQVPARHLSFQATRDEMLSVATMRKNTPSHCRSSTGKMLCLTDHRSPITYHFPRRAVSSAVERLVYTERVGGSNPSPPIFV